MTFQKSSNQGHTLCTTLPKSFDFKTTKLSDYVKQYSVLSDFDEKSISSDFIMPSTPIKKRIEEKVERAGKPLKDWNINIHQGVGTGLAGAFVIDGKTKDELKNKEIVRPLLRGKDIERYDFSKLADQWLIYIPWHFPLHKETVKGASEEAEREFRNQYPDIYSHLLKYKEPLSNRKEKTALVMNGMFYSGRD